MHGVEVANTGRILATSDTAECQKLLPYRRVAANGARVLLSKSLTIYLPSSLHGDLPHAADSASSGSIFSRNAVRPIVHNSCTDKGDNLERDTEEQIKAPTIDQASLTEAMARVRDEISKAIVGQAEVIDGVLVALLAGGHVLLEGVPGLGKTMLVRTLAQTLALKYSRIQFTPDLMPADVIGTSVIQ